MVTCFPMTGCSFLALLCCWSSHLTLGKYLPNGQTIRLSFEHYVFRMCRLLVPTSAFLEKKMLWKCIVMYSQTSCIIIHNDHVPTIPPHHHLPRPPTLPPKPQRMRKSRPRSIFNRKLFNGNMEAFIQVLAHLCSLSLHELSCLTSSPWGGSLAFCPLLFYPNVGSLMHWLSLLLIALSSQSCHSGKSGWGWKKNNKTCNRTCSGGGLIS